MTILSNADLAALVRSHWTDGAVSIVVAGQPNATVWETAYAICRAESGSNPTIIGGAGEVGLWQIVPTQAILQKYGITINDLKNPDINATVASSMSNNGQNWLPWCTWEKPACGGNGKAAYRVYLQEAHEAVYSSPPPPPTNVVLAVSICDWDFGICSQTGQNVEATVANGLTHIMETVTNFGTTEAMNIVVRSNFEAWQSSATLPPGQSFQRIVAISVSDISIWRRLEAWAEGVSMVACEMTLHPATPLPPPSPPPQRTDYVPLAIIAAGVIGLVLATKPSTQQNIHINKKLIIKKNR